MRPHRLFLLIILLKMGFRYELGLFLRKLMTKTWKRHDFHLESSSLMTFFLKRNELTGKIHQLITITAHQPRQARTVRMIYRILLFILSLTYTSNNREG